VSEPSRARWLARAAPNVKDRESHARVQDSPNTSDHNGCSTTERSSPIWTAFRSRWIAVRPLRCAVPQPTYVDRETPIEQPAAQLSGTLDLREGQSSQRLNERGHRRHHAISTRSRPSPDRLLIGRRSVYASGLTSGGWSPRSHTSRSLPGRHRLEL
jgi:hypothetical protein